MIDLKELRTRRDEIAANITNRSMHVDIDAVIALQERRSTLLQTIDALRSRRNDIADRMKEKLDQHERIDLVSEGKRIKEQIAILEKEREAVEHEYLQAAKNIPNFTHPDTPIGKTDADNREIRRCGEIPDFSFIAKDHLAIGQALDLIDFETASRVSGPKFYYLKNEAVLLELALERYAIDVLLKEGFTPLITPDIARTEILEGIGFNPRGEESNIYTIEGTGTCLVGTAEITLGGYYADTIFEPEDLPIYFAGLSHCFRREAGGAGQYAKGLYRVHQFSKVEMFVYCPVEQSEAMHERLLAIEERIFTDLQIPYRVMDICSGDLGAPAYRKFDIEAWMPGRGAYGEVTSTSNCTDYQARNLNIKYRDEEGHIRYVHMLNGTAIALSRTIVAILENFQCADGSVRMPPILVPYLGFDIIKRKKEAEHGTVCIDH